MNDGPPCCQIVELRKTFIRCTKPGDPRQYRRPLLMINEGMGRRLRSRPHHRDQQPMVRHLTLPPLCDGPLPLPPQGPQGQRGALDEPDSRLAILGPPAVTRMMVELWRADPGVRSQFDLANPLHRRDFAQWLGREGKSLGLDESSIAAASALL